MYWQTARAVDSYRPHSEDRTAVLETPIASFFLIADGVGGRSGGAAAAELFIAFGSDFACNLTHAPRANEIMDFMRTLDCEMTKRPNIGETTAIFLAATDRHLVGAAVGESVAWWIDEKQMVNLTRDCGRKPWLGSGMAVIQPIGHPASNGTLLLATDGLSKYADAHRLCEIARRSSLESSSRELIEAVRPPSGTLPDDVAVILGRPFSMDR